MTTAAEFEEAGLYDPAAPEAADRLVLLEWLTEQGFDVEQIRAADDAGNITALAGDALLLGDATLSLRDMVAVTGLTIEALVDIQRASGLSAIDPDERCFTAKDVETFKLFAAATNFFSTDEILHFTRVLGSSVARVAEAANSLFLDDVERPLTDAGGSEYELAKANLLAVNLVSHVSSVMDTLLRFHIRQTTDRFRSAYRRSEGSGNSCVAMAIGFVDLCGFTAHSGQLSTDDLAGIVRAFEARAYDIVSAHGGRVVKLIGDEVMFTAVEAATACTIASALATGFADEDLTPRGGVAFGPVLARGGDYYGPIVNLASRIADLAVPGEILATTAVAEAAAGHAFSPAGRRQLKGFPEPVELVSFS